MGMISKIYKSPHYQHEAYAGWSKATKPPKPKEQPAQRRPLMIWNRNRFEVHNSYEEREKLKKWGFQFDPAVKCWVTGKPRVAVLALKYADDESRQMIHYFMTN